jgi:hypothetical protein
MHGFDTQTKLRIYFDYEYIIGEKGHTDGGFVIASP